MSNEMVKMERVVKVIESDYLSSLAKLLMLIYLGYNRKKKLIKAGLSSSLVYTNLLKLVSKNLVIITETGEITLTDKGKVEAEKLVKCLDNL